MDAKDHASVSVRWPRRGPRFRAARTARAHRHALSAPKSRRPAAVDAHHAKREYSGVNTHLVRRARPADLFIRAKIELKFAAVSISVATDQLLVEEAIRKSLTNDPGLAPTSPQRPSPRIRRCEGPSIARIVGTGRNPKASALTRKGREFARSAPKAPFHKLKFSHPTRGVSAQDRNVTRRAT